MLDMSVNTSIFNGTNTTSNVLQTSTRPVDYAKTTAVVFVALGTLVGNHLIVFTFLKNYKMRTVTNTLVINMCVADIVCVVGDVLFYLTEALNNEVFHQFAFCRVSIFVFQCSTQVVVSSMVAIAIDRYYNLVRILLRRLRREHVRVIVCFVWLQSIVTSLPWDLWNRRSFSFALDMCARLPYQHAPGMNMRVFRETLVILTVLLPYLFILWIFIQVLLSARRRRAIKVEDTAVVSRAPKTEGLAIQSYGRSTVTAIMLFSTFLILTLPFLGSVCWSAFTGQVNSSYKMELAVFFLFRLQGVLLPMIYLFRNKFAFDFLRMSHDYCRAHHHMKQRQKRNVQHLRTPSQYKHRQGLLPESTKSKYLKQANRIKIFYTTNAQKELRNTFSDLSSVGLENETGDHTQHNNSAVFFIKDKI